MILSRIETGLQTFRAQSRKRRWTTVHRHTFCTETESSLNAKSDSITIDWNFKKHARLRENDISVDPRCAYFPSALASSGKRILLLALAKPTMTHYCVYAFIRFWVRQRWLLISTVPLPFIALYKFVDESLLSSLIPFFALAFLFVCFLFFLLFLFLCFIHIKMQIPNSSVRSHTCTRTHVGKVWTPCWR